MELLGRYSNQYIVTRLQRILAGQGRERLSARPTRSVRQTQHRLTVEEVDQLVEQRLAGQEIDELSTAFNIHRATVMEHLRRARVPHRRNLVTEHLDEARRLYEQGLSLAKIGEHLGVHASTVWYAFRKVGIAMRDPHRRWP